MNGPGTKPGGRLGLALLGPGLIIAATGVGAGDLRHKSSDK